mmetsp:Transcript_37490/g.60920  ORF Transcript_37490/g.60920 Transcript_37490/m.60920 type:complete len:317 (+) Transcript_37490:128-1078(+)
MGIEILYKTSFQEIEALRLEDVIVNREYKKYGFPRCSVCSFSKKTFFKGENAIHAMQKLLAHTKMKPDPKGDHKRLFAFLSMKLGKRFNKADLAYCPPGIAAQVGGEWSCIVKNVYLLPHYSKMHNIIVMKGNRKEEDWESEDDILGEIRSKKRNRETWGEPRDSREHLKNGTTQPRHVRYDEQLEEEEKERELDGIARETGLDTGGKEEYEKQEENEKKDQSGRQSAADIQVLRPTSAMSVKNKLTAETKRSIEDQFHDLLQVEQVYKLQRSLPAILKKVDDMKLGDAERKAAKKYCQRVVARDVHIHTITLSET